MFAHHCSHCDKRQLIFPSRITGIDNTAGGIVVDFVCWCGSPQTLLTGKRADERGAVVRTPAAAA